MAKRKIFCKISFDGEGEPAKVAFPLKTAGPPPKRRVRVSPSQFLQGLQVAQPRPDGAKPVNGASTRGRLSRAGSPLVSKLSFLLPAKAGLDQTLRSLIVWFLKFDFPRSIFSSASLRPDSL
jgi:hypothetical protein